MPVWSEHCFCGGRGQDYHHCDSSVCQNSNTHCTHGLTSCPYLGGRTWKHEVSFMTALTFCIIHISHTRGRQGSFGDSCPWDAFVCYDGVMNIIALMCTNKRCCKTVYPFHQAQKGLFRVVCCTYPYTYTASLTMQFILLWSRWSADYQYIDNDAMFIVDLDFFSGYTLTEKSKISVSIILVAMTLK